MDTEQKPEFTMRAGDVLRMLASIQSVRDHSTCCRFAISVAQSNAYVFRCDPIDPAKKAVFIGFAHREIDGEHGNILLAASYTIPTLPKPGTWLRVSIDPAGYLRIKEDIDE